MADNTFLVSVANAIGLDATTGQALFYGKTNLTSAFELSMASTDVRGGINNPLLYKYMHDRDLSVNVEQAIFAKTFLALNVGSNVLNQNVNVLNTECISLVGGAGVVTETPIGNISVIKDDGTIVTVTPTGKNFTVPGGGSTNVTAIYRYSDQVDRISISTTNPPSIITLILEAEVRNTAGVIIEKLQIEVPRFQIDGNYSLSLSADGVSQEALNGMALATSGTNCVDGDVYAYVSWIPTALFTTPVASIATTPSEFTVSIASGLPKTQQLTTLGIRGGVYSNVILASGVTYTKRSGGNANVTVSSTGLITVASGATASTTLIDVAYNNGVEVLTDTMVVTVTA